MTWSHEAFRCHWSAGWWMDGRWNRQYTCLRALAFNLSLLYIRLGRLALTAIGWAGLKYAGRLAGSVTVMDWLRGDWAINVWCHWTWIGWETGRARVRELVRKKRERRALEGEWHWVCVCEREKWAGLKVMEREREGERGACVCVCVCFNST